jgi:hypothetical protein
MRLSAHSIAVTTVVVFVTLTDARKVLRAQSARTGALAGIVRDSEGRVLPGSQIVLLRSGSVVAADDSGRFHVKDVPSGKAEVTFRHIGFEPATVEVTISPDSTVMTEVRLTRRTLPEALVLGEKLSPALARTGFYERASLRLGQFLAPEEVERRSWANRPSALLRDFRGIDVRCYGTRCIVTSRASAGGCIQVFVNGAYRRGQLDEVVSVSEVFALEFYDRGTKVPAEFQGNSPAAGGLTGTAGCGVIAIWTHAKA